MRRLLIADLNSRDVNGESLGHYVPVARNYLEAMDGMADVRIAGGPVYAKYFDEALIFRLPYSVRQGANLVLNKLKVLLNCRALFRKAGSDIIVIQHSAIATVFIGIVLFASKKNTIYVIEYDTDSVSSGFKRLVYSLARKHIKGVICPRESIGKAFGVGCCVVSDFLYHGTGLEVKKSYEEREYDFAMVGTVTEGKGVVAAAKALAGKACKVIIAGRATENDSQILKETASSCDNIELHLGFVSDENYRKYISSSRFSLMNYHGVYNDRSSGVVLDSLYAGTPIVGRRCSALGFVEEHSLGWLFDDIGAMDFDKVLDPKTYEACLDNVDAYLNTLLKEREILSDYLNLNG